MTLKEPMGFQESSMESKRKNPTRKHTQKKGFLNRINSVEQ